MPLPDTLGGQANRLLEQRGMRPVARQPKAKQMVDSLTRRSPSQAPPTYNPMQGMGPKVRPMMAPQRQAAAFDPTDILAWLSKVGDAVRRTVASAESIFGSVTRPDTPGTRAAADAFRLGGVTPPPAKPWWQR